MKSYGPREVRVVGLFGHRGAGKTSLVEGMLFNAGATSRLGHVDDKTLTLETDPEALERQTTMHANVGFVEWEGVRIGLIDTPGDGNFWGASNRVLDVVDAAIVVVSGADGVEPIALRALAALDERSLPYAVVISKLDKDGSDFDGVIAEIKEDVGKDTVAVSMPIGVGPGFAGVVSLLAERAYLPDGDTTREADIPSELSAAVSSEREKLFDAVAAADDELAEKYLDAGTLNKEELARGLRAAFLKRQIVPVLAANPTRNVGNRVLLNLIKSAFPSGLERPVMKGFRTNSLEEPMERPPNENGPLVARVFRTHHDPFAGQLSFARIFSGRLTASTDIYNSTRASSDRPSHMYFPEGDPKHGVEIKEATVGDLVALTKLKITHTGDTLTSKDDPICLAPFQEPEALLNYGITASDQKSEDKMAQAIAKMVQEDPSLRWVRDQESKETLIGGLGQPHIDYVVHALKRQGVDVQLRDPKVPYKETFRTGAKEVEGKHKKQTGGSGQFGVCYIHLEPSARGTGVEFCDEIVGGSIPRNFIPSVEKGVRDALKRGPISGSEVVDIKVRLYDGKYHRVDSSDVAFQIAGRKAIRAAYQNKTARAVLLEPYMTVDIVCPAEVVGEVMGDLNSRRARVHNMTTEGRRGEIAASVPMNEMLKYTNVLKSITSGRGSFTMKFERYEEAPPDVQQAIAAQYTVAAEED
jgi:elongation factor G